jgi:hypothetical protein
MIGSKPVIDEAGENGGNRSAVTARTGIVKGCGDRL